MPISDPRDIPGLVLWYSADAETTYADGDEMSAWTDRSGNGNHATGVAGSGGAKPLFREFGGPNGGARVRFQSGTGNAVGGYFTLPNVLSALSSGEVCAAVRSTDNRNSLWNLGTSGDQSHYPYEGGVYEDFGRGSLYSFFPTANSLFQWRRYGAWAAASDFGAVLDGVTVQTASSGGVSFPTAPRLGQDGIYNLSGDVAEFVIYDHKLTTLERADLDAWLDTAPVSSSPLSPSQVVLFDGVAATSLGAGAESLGFEFEVDEPDTTVDAIRYYHSRGIHTGVRTGAIYRQSDAVKVSETVTFDAPDGGWQTAPLTTPFLLLTGVRYVAVVHFPDGFYLTSGFFTTGPGASGITAGPVTAFSDATATAGQGRHLASGSLAFPTSGGAGEFYGVDVVVGIPGLDPPDRTLSLAGTTPRRIGAFALSAGATLTLAGQVGRRVGAFGVESTPSLSLSGESQRRVATFTMRATIPVVPAPVVEAGASVVVAQAFGPMMMQGTQAVYSVSEAAIPRARQQIIVDGIDVTFFRGVPTPDVTYTLLEPLLYGPGTLDLPQVVACHESGNFGVGELSWLREDAPVEVRYVLDNPDGTTTPTGIGGYKGFIVAFDTTGRVLSVELGGEANGRAALRDWQVPKFPRVNDIGHQAAILIRRLGLQFEPNLGPETGIEVMTTGGVGHLDQIEDIIARAWTRAGRQWSIMPDENGVYRMRRKDDTTIHATVFFDDANTVQKLRRDKAEEPNRIFATAVGPNGMRIDGAVYPGLVQGKPPPFPGHMELGDTGPGVRMLILKLQGIGYLKLEDAGGGYDDDVFKAVVELQKDAGLFDDGFTTPTVPGEVNQLTWDALYDLNVTSLSVEGAHVEPMAQRSKVKEWNRNGSGNITGPNPNFDASVVPVDRTLAMGQAGMNTSQVREASRTVLHDSDDPNWVGTITFNTGALIRGEKGIGAVLTAADVMDARELESGMNVWAPAWDGGTLFHIAAADPVGTPSITVDTRFRDAMDVWQILARNRESRSDPTRSGNRKHRSSTLVKDSIGEWDQVGGLLNQDVDLDAGWNVFPVVAAQEGTIAWLRIKTDPAVEFVTAVFGEKIGPGTLQALIGNPLSKKGSAAWSRQAVRQELNRDYELLYVAGDSEQPCGYYPRAKPSAVDLADAELLDEEPVDDEGAPLTGVWEDDAGFAYRSRVKHMVWVAVYALHATTIPAGRIMRQQLEAGA